MAYVKNKREIKVKVVAHNDKAVLFNSYFQILLPMLSLETHLAHKRTLI